MASKQEQQQTQNLHNEEAEQLIVDSLEKYLVALIDPKTNSKERESIYRDLILLCEQQVDIIPEIISFIAEKFANNKNVYLAKALETLLNSKSLTKAVRESKRVLSKDNLIMLGSVIGMVTSNVDVSQKKTFTGLLEGYLSVVSAIASGSAEENETDTWNKTVLATRELGQNIALAILDEEVVNHPDRALALFTAWKNEAVRIDTAGNLLVQLLLQSNDKTLQGDHAVVVSDILVTLNLSEINFFKVSKEAVQQRNESALRTYFNSAYSDERGAHKEKKVYNSIDFSEGYTKRWKPEAKKVEQFINDDTIPFYFSLFPARQFEISNLATHEYLRRRMVELNEVPNAKKLFLIIPDKGTLLVVWREELTSELEIREMIKRELRVYLESRSTERLYTAEQIFIFLLTDLCIENVDEDALRIELAENRKKAAGGFFAISRRGDAVRFKPKKSEGDKYLTALGIHTLVFKQEEKGIRCDLVWFNTTSTFYIDKNYMLQDKIDVEGLPQLAVLWIENLLLSYIGGIKYNEGSKDEVVADSNEASTGEREFKGKRTHLRVLPLGHVAKGMDMQHPHEVSFEKSEEHEFMVTNFGVTLFTLNGVFIGLQEGQADINDDSQLQALIDMYEEVLDEDYKMTTDLKSVRSLMEKAFLAIEEKDVKIKSLKNKMLIAFNGGEFVETDQRFNITVSAEAVVDGEIQVAPLTFWMKSVSDRLCALAQKED